MKPLDRAVAREAKTMTRREILMKALDGRIKWTQAADILGMTPRNVRRLRAKLEQGGWQALHDGRFGRPRAKRIPEKTVSEVLRLRRERYQDFSVLHFHEHLTEKHGLKLSYTWTKQLLIDAGLAEKAPARGKYHRHRERRSMTGMLVHLDASTHGWIEGLEPWDLVVALDDADGRMLYGRFVEEEGTQSTLEALSVVLTEHGRFCELYTDRGSHFCRTEEAGQGPAAEQRGQVTRVLKALGIRHILARSPQARGRSERAFGTVQGRLPQELKLHGITEYTAANRYLEQTFIPDFNSRFTVAPTDKDSAFTSLAGVNLELMLSTHHERTVQNDNTVVFEKLRLQLEPTLDRPHLVRCPVVVHELLDHTLAVSFNGLVVGRFDRQGQPLANKKSTRSAA